jgi:urease gamma subunit
MKKTTNWKDATNVNVVMAEVKASPDNLTAAFKNAAVKLNISEGCVSQAWYNNIRSKVNGFRTKSTKVNYVNVKNSPRKATNVSSPIHEVVVDSKMYDGMKIVTVRQYFTV